MRWEALGWFGAEGSCGLSFNRIIGCCVVCGEDGGRDISCKVVGITLERDDDILEEGESFGSSQILDIF